jgi:hypothetical protein
MYMTRGLPLISIRSVSRAEEHNWPKCQKCKIHLGLQFQVLYLNMIWGKYPENRCFQHLHIEGYGI